MTFEHLDPEVVELWKKAYDDMEKDKTTPTAPAAATPPAPPKKIIRFSPTMKIRLRCKRAKCRGVVEQFPEDLLKLKPPIIRCPECKAELSEGARGSFVGDRAMVLVTMFRALCQGTYSPGFEVELLDE